MCRTIHSLAIIVISVLSMATVGYGVVIGDFEGGMDGWAVAAGSEADVTISIDTAGATLNQNSLKIQSPIGNMGVVVLDLIAADLVDEFRNNLKVSVDITRLVAEWVEVDSAWNDFTMDLVAAGNDWELNADLAGTSRWDPVDYNDAPIHFVYNYSLLLSDIDFDNLDTLQLVFAQNYGGYDPGGTTYIDNVQLIGGGQSYAPSPRDTARDMPLNTKMSWTPGIYADKHDVFFGTNFDDVNDAVKPDNPRSLNPFLVSREQDGNTFDPGPLAVGTTYYWRIDDVNGEDTWKGDVWSFTTSFGDATVWGDWEGSMDGWDSLSGSPTFSFSSEYGVTLNGMSLKVEVQSGWYWTLRFISSDNDLLEVLKANDRLSVDITWVPSDWTGEGTYAAIDEFAINSGATGWWQINDLASDSANPENPGFWNLVDYNEVHTRTVVWDYSGTNDDGAGVADIEENGWFQIFINIHHDFEDGGTFYLDNLQLLNSRAPYNPVPINEATDVETDPVLNWTPGDRAVSHNIFIGTNLDDINDVNEATIGNYPDVTFANTTDSRFEPPALEMDTTYYWRVDAVNEPNVWASKVWSFTTGRFLAVDTFERYTDNRPNRIFETWRDQYSYTDEFGNVVDQGNGSNATVGVDESPFGPERVIVHTGLQSMPLSYNNADAPYYSETDRTFDSPWNFATASNGEAFERLSLFIRGRWASPNGMVYDAGTGQYTVTGSGTDIWDTADQFHFVYQTLNGDGSITAKVESIDDTSDWAKAGIMIRNGLEPGAVNAAVFATPSGRITFQQRQFAGSETINQETGENSITLPYWVRLTKAGGIITAEMSTDGQTWENIPANGNSTTALSLFGDVQIGLAVTSQVDAGTPCEAVFSNVTVQGTTRSIFNESDGMDIGLPVNSPDSLYVALQDNGGTTAVVNHPENPDAILNNDWAEFSIPLSDFSDQGVDLSQIRKMFIGLGNKNNPMTAGTGKLFIDDIRLYLPN